MTFDDFIARFPDARKVRDGEVKVRCPLPVHRDSDPSVDVKRAADRILVFDHAGCSTEAIVAAVGCTMADLFLTRNGHGHGSRNGASEASRLVAVYPYTDERGEVLYEVCRMEPKAFRQRRADGRGGYRWTLGDVRRVPYHLHELQGREEVLLDEGEKDADRLWALGLAATTNAGGAGKWTAALTADLVACGVERAVILPDNDAPGRKHAVAVARQLITAGIAAKILELPGLPPKGDVSNWLDAGGTRAQLEALIAAAPEIVEADLVEPGQELPAEVLAHSPVIDATEQDLAKVADAAWVVLQRANEPPTIFRFAAQPTRVVQDDHGACIMERLGVDEFRHYMARVATWVAEKVVFGKRSTRAVHPPIAVIRDMLAHPEPPLPRLVRVVEVPIFTKAGTVIVRPGYDAASGILYAPPKDLAVPAVPEQPSDADIARARALLVDELLADFPFTGDAERAQAVAMVLEPIVRDLIDGPTPLYLIEKPSPGTGASLLAECPARIITGRPGSVMTEGRDEDEWRKRVTSKLITGAPILLLDNLRRRLDSAAVASAITAPVWEDRVLGQSEMIRIPVRCSWIATGNNPTLSAEMVRRAVRIRLDAKLAEPWLREAQDFRHPDLRGWIQQARSELVWAVLVLGQAWLARGRPAAPVRQLGMFESWSRVMGGILATAEIPGFLTALAEFYAASDVEGSDVRAFLGAWWEKHGDDKVTAAALLELATAPESALDIDARTEQGRKVRFGKLLTELRDRRYRLGDEFLVKVERAGTLHQAALWRLVGESWEFGESVSPLRTRAGARARTHAQVDSAGPEETPKTPQTPTGGGDQPPSWVTEELFGESRESVPAARDDAGPGEPW